MESDKQRILGWLHRCQFPSGALLFDDILIDAAERALGKSRIDAEAFASPRNILMYWGWMRATLEDAKERGIAPLFSIADQDSRHLVWVAREPVNNSDSRYRAKLMLLRSRPTILSEIDLLSDREYEALGCVIAHLLGAERNRILLTPRGNEGGVDFFASVVVFGKSHVFSGLSCPLRIVGQSKKYEGKASLDDIKNFITTLTWIKNLHPRVDRLVPAWFRAARGPIIGWVTSHKGFQEGAVAESKNQGIILSDSLDFCEIAALSRALTPDYGAEARAGALRTSVARTLDEFS